MAADVEGRQGTTGSGSCSMSSAVVADVSIVMSLVGIEGRNVKNVPQHLTATDGFLWPGR